MTYVGLALLSAAALAFEITLTRLFSVTQWYHFAFLAVSVALLGYGASGTALSLLPRWTQPPAARRACYLSALFAVTPIGAYLCLNHLPFDSYRIAWERIQVLYLLLYYLSLAVPFFCAGLVTGLLLATYPAHTPRLYAANLLGSAAGGLVPLLVVPLVGEGTVLCIAALGLLAATCFEVASARSHSGGDHRRLFSLLRVAVLLAVGCALTLLSWRPPEVYHLRLSPYKGLSQVLRFPESRAVWQRWNAFSRVDRVASSAIRSAPGLSLGFAGDLPKEDGLFVDGDDLSPVLTGLDAQPGTGGQPSSTLQDLEGFTSHLPAALPYELRRASRVLILEPRGGLDVWTALSQGASSVVAVESNRLVIEAAGPVYQDSRVEVVVEEGRSYAHRSRSEFDIVHLALTDSYRPVTSGAYSLGERYDLTVEAFQDYLARLRPEGILVIERWLQLPPSEELRVGATAVEALRRAGIGQPSRQMVVVRGWQLGLILVKNEPFTADELAAIRTFCERQGLDLVAMPGLAEDESNRYNILSEPVYFRAFQQLFSDPDALYAGSIYDVRPTTDDRPFFFHFFKWSQAQAVLAQLGRTWQPWGGSGYFVLIALLVVAAAASVVLILLPLAAHRRRGGLEGRWALKLRVVFYFGLLGLGFLFVEIPLLQRFILFLGQPIYAFAAVLASLLFFSGLGSLASPRLAVRWVLPLLVAAILLYPLLLPFLFRGLLGSPLALRLLATALSLAPLGFLMGTPFPAGLRWLQARAPGLIAWAWAINGCASVVASILAAMIALSAGFAWVLAAAALAYGAAWLAARDRPSGAAGR